MSERKNLTITQVEEIKKVGDKQIPKLSFKAKDGDKELTYFTFKSSLFEQIKEGQTINADIETEQKGEYTNRKIVQVYVDGQSVSSKKQGYYGKSPEELDLSARAYALSYAKDLAVGDKIKVVDIIIRADIFYDWLKVSFLGRSGVPKVPETKLEDEIFGSPEAKAPVPTGKGVQNITELKNLLMKHKIPTHEAYEILSINKSFTELTITPDEAWEKIKKAKGI
jgi:hypothetical protein